MSRPAPAHPSSSAPKRTRYVIVGLGARHEMFREAIEKTYAQHAELVGVCDVNPGRVELARTRRFADEFPPPRGYLASEFDRMLKETTPDYVIVTTVDATHDDFIVRAMEAGCDVITEKPMTTSVEKCRRILDAKKRTGRRIRVTFNYRYSPARVQLKDMLQGGQIGDVLSVDFHWMLNTHHGADYFRRWHSRKASSGGLMVHKATHHFDLMNWWLGAMPVSVSASGKRAFYTPDMGDRFGLTSRGERCHTCPERARCTFSIDLAANSLLKSMYLDQEAHDGYFRDRCIWRPEIDIEDSMNVVVDYDNGVTMAYSLNAFTAWEGYTVVFNGTLGRLEQTLVEASYISGKHKVQGGIIPGGVTTRLVPLRGPATVVPAWDSEGGHGGGDSIMLDEIFLPNPPADKYLRASDERSGALSILVGIAANQCFETNEVVAIDDLIAQMERPDYSPMPSRTAPLPLPVPCAD